MVMVAGSRAKEGGRLYWKPSNFKKTWRTRVGLGLLVTGSCVSRDSSPRLVEKMESFAVSVMGDDG